LALSKIKTSFRVQDERIPSVSYCSHTTEEDVELEELNKQVISLDFPSGQYDTVLFLQSHAVLHNGASWFIFTHNINTGLFRETVR
jgi:hypothetical protein